jgi:hypothetical protein
MGQISGAGIEDASLIAGGGLAVVIDGGETSQGDAEGKAQVIAWGLMVEFFDVLGEWGSFWPIDSFLSPFLRVAPWGGAGLPELNGLLPSGLMIIKRTF